MIRLWTKWAVWLERWQKALHRRRASWAFARKICAYGYADQIKEIIDQHAKYRIDDADILRYMNTQLRRARR